LTKINQRHTLTDEVRMAEVPHGPARRRQILQGFRRAIAERGMDGLDMAAVAREAGVATGEPPYHFVNMQAMRIGLVEDLADEAEETLEIALTAVSSDPWERLDAYVASWLAPAGEAGALRLASWVAVSAASLVEVPVRQAYQRAVSQELARASGLVREVLRVSGLPGEGAETLASDIWMLIQGAFSVGTASPWLVTPAGCCARVQRLARMLVLSAPAEKRP
jgi:AcrR family transcriptional regulator